MPASLYPFNTAADTEAGLYSRHIHLCARDIAMVAELILAGQGKDFHSQFCAELVRLRRYNRLALPETQWQPEALFSRAKGLLGSSFAMEIEEKQKERRLLSGDPHAREEITLRVLSDSSPYIETAKKWLERNRHMVHSYRNSEQAVRFLMSSHILTTYEGIQLRSMIDDICATNSAVPQKVPGEPPTGPAILRPV